MTEYALVLLLIAVIALAVLTAVGVGTTNHLGSVNQNMR
jgi:Flp pilus assembly pilin Flp